MCLHSSSGCWHELWVSTGRVQTGGQQVAMINQCVKICFHSSSMMWSEDGTGWLSEQRHPPPSRLVALIYRGGLSLQAVLLLAFWVTADLGQLIMVGIFWEPRKGP